MTKFQFTLKVDDQFLDKSLDAIYFNNQEINDESVFTMIKKGERILCHIDMLKPVCFKFEFKIDNIPNINSVKEVNFSIEFNNKSCSVEINEIHLLDTEIKNT